LQQRLLREPEHLVVGGATHATQELRRVMNSEPRIGIQSHKALRGGTVAATSSAVLARAAASAIGGSRIVSADHTSRNVTSCMTSATHAFGHRVVLRAADRHELRARPALHQAAALELAQRLAHGGAVHAELTRQLRFRRQALTLAQAAAHDALTDRRRHLPVGRLDEYLLEADPVGR
jgi:hypothetical protein